MSSGTEGVGQTSAGLGPAAAGLTKRQREVLERLELGMPVKKIANDTGVTPAAVYQTIDRLRRQGALPQAFTPSGQPPRRAPGADALATGAAAFGPAAIAPRESALAGMRELAREGAGEAARADAIEAAIASADVAALAYELGRADAEGRDDMSAKLAKAALRRIGALGAKAEDAGA
jgi:DNA-binding CsgD family transcriptional regulator